MPNAGRFLIMLHNFEVGSKFFCYQLMHKRIVLKGILKIYIKTAPT